jgi:hypothetical protein
MWIPFAVAVAAEAGEDLVALAVGVGVLLLLPLADEVERRLGDVDHARPRSGPASAGRRR